jgi:carboxymethylenebutenolidase
VTIKVFADAGHGFHADYRDSYNKADAEAGWVEAVSWFKQYGVA